MVCVGYHYGLRPNRPVEVELKRTITMPVEIEPSERYPVTYLDFKLPSCLSEFCIVRVWVSREPSFSQIEMTSTCKDCIKATLQKLGHLNFTYQLRYVNADCWHIEVCIPGLDIVYVVCENRLIGNVVCVSGAVGRKMMVVLTVDGDEVDIVPVGTDFKTNMQLFAAHQDGSYYEYMSSDEDRISRGVYSMGELIELSKLMDVDVAKNKLLFHNHRVSLETFYVKGWKGVHYTCRKDCQTTFAKMYRSE